MRRAGRANVVDVVRFRVVARARTLRRARQGRGRIHRDEPYLRIGSRGQLQSGDQAAEVAARFGHQINRGRGRQGELDPTAVVGTGSRAGVEPHFLRGDPHVRVLRRGVAGYRHIGARRATGHRAAQARDRNGKCDRYAVHDANPCAMRGDDVPTGLAPQRAGWPVHCVELSSRFTGLAGELDAPGQSLYSARRQTSLQCSVSTVSLAVCASPAHFDLPLTPSLASDRRSQKLPGEFDNRGFPFICHLPISG